MQVRCGRCDGTEGGTIRYGLTASRRVGNAVARNRVRRRLRAVAEQILPLYARRGCDYVLIGRASTVDRPYQALIRDVTAALKRLRVYRQPTAVSDNRTAEPSP